MIRSTVDARRKGREALLHLEADYATARNVVMSVLNAARYDCRIVADVSREIAMEYVYGKEDR